MTVNNDIYQSIDPWSFDHLTNVGHVIAETARRLPNQIAVAAPIASRIQRTLRYDSISFSDLEVRSNQVAAFVQQLGIQPGTRLALMIPPGIDFVTFVFGLFKAGIVIILIDPGMGRKNMLQCLSDAEPAGIVGIWLAQLMRNLFSSKFPHAIHNVLTGNSWWPGAISSKKIWQTPSEMYSPCVRPADSEAAIIFTTGSTGPPKGVLYRHQMFLAQARQIRNYFGIRPGTVDVSGFPLFALFNAAMGTTTVFPRMDATRPAAVDPLDIHHAVQRFNANQSFGSPALWNTVSRHSVSTGLRFDEIKTVLTAGAPVPNHVLERVKQIIADDGEVYTPYGATEALPIACISATEVIDETGEHTNAGKGTCVGHRFPEMEWKIIRITDQPIATIDGAEELSQGAIGELIVSGVVVSDRYVTQLKANAEHKIMDGQRIWHRMGDVGYFDEKERFWFCGRKSHRVVTNNKTMFTVPVEGVVNTHPEVYRSALVGIGQRGYQLPAIIVEPWPEFWSANQQDQRRLQQTVLALCAENEITSEIETVLVKKKLPVDIRHNSKIFREKLTDWARERC